MKPRLKTSNKWTALPKEYVKQIQDVFNETFATQLKNGELIVEGRIYPQEILLRVGYLEKGRLLQANFEASADYSKQKNDAVDRIYNCIDLAASMMDEYFAKEGEAELPYVWEEIDFKGQKMFYQYSGVNSKLEAEADRLLGLAAEDLVVDERSDEKEES